LNCQPVDGVKYNSLFKREPTRSWAAMGGSDAGRVQALPYWLADIAAPTQGTRMKVKKRSQGHEQLKRRKGVAGLEKTKKAAPEVERTPGERSGGGEGRQTSLEGGLAI